MIGAIAVEPPSASQGLASLLSTSPARGGGKLQSRFFLSSPVYGGSVAEGDGGELL
jgi:hypothetical protein